MSEDRQLSPQSNRRGHGRSARDFLSRRPHTVPAVLAAVMLLAALGHWPYDYYRLLRWVTCAAAVFIAYHGWAWKRLWATWLFGFVAALFNPIFPVHFSTGLWQVIDVAAAAQFVVAIIVLAKPGSKQPKAQGQGVQPMKFAIRLTRAEVIVLWVAAALIVAMCLRPPCWYAEAGGCGNLITLMHKLEYARRLDGSVHLPEIISLEEVRQQQAAAESKRKPSALERFRQDTRRARKRIDSKLLSGARWELEHLRHRPGLHYSWLWSFPAHIAFDVLAFQCLIVLFAGSILVFGLWQLRTRRGTGRAVTDS